jgi:hypothetical protein
MADRLIAARRLLAVGVLVNGCLMLTASSTPLEAQEFEFPVEESEWLLMNLRPTGQPVIPIFEGWMARPDGSHDLCFGYFNMNMEEAIDIPLGPDNLIEPAEFNGLQPTHFLEVPEREGRYYCVFTVNVPADFGAKRVVWTLRQKGRTFEVPGHTTLRGYQITDLVHVSRDLMAPKMQFVQPEGPAIVGKRGGTAGVSTIPVGAPLKLSVSVAHPNGEGLAAGLAWWGKYRGPPGENVRFSRRVLRFSATEASAVISATTEVTFDDPGDYMVFVQARQGSFGDQCCWTNGYLNVTVTP